ncbi:MAG: hypothetical protein SFT91_05935 [Rickettsiaceae bacterium]|nr:hypothetical protein [Rickettsiaceae bacterium]
MSKSSSMASSLREENAETNKNIQESSELDQQFSSETQQNDNNSYPGIE